MVLEIEADEKELNVDYDDIVSRPAPDVTDAISLQQAGLSKRISDSLLPPPVGRTGSLVSANTPTSTVVEMPKPQKEMSPGEVRIALERMMSLVQIHAPNEIEVMPPGSDQKLTLKRQIDTIPDAGMVRLSYRLGVEASSTPSSSSRSNTQASEPTAMAVDTPPSAAFSVFDDGDFRDTLDNKMDAIRNLADFIYRKNKPVVVSKTPIRQGSMSFDPRLATHEDA